MHDISTIKVIGASVALHTLVMRYDMWYIVQIFDIELILREPNTSSWASDTSQMLAELPSGISWRKCVANHVQKMTLTVKELTQPRGAS